LKAVAEGVAEQANRAEKSISNENQSMSQTLSEEAVVQWQAKYKQSDPNPNPNPNPNWQAKYKQSEKLKERLLSCVSELEEKLNQSQASKNPNLFTRSP